MSGKLKENLPIYSLSTLVTLKTKNPYSFGTFKSGVSTYKIAHSHDAWTLANRSKRCIVPIRNMRLATYSATPFSPKSAAVADKFHGNRLGVVLAALSVLLHPFMAKRLVYFPPEQLTAFHARMGFLMSLVAFIFHTLYSRPRASFRTRSVRVEAAACNQWQPSARLPLVVFGCLTSLGSTGRPTCATGPTNQGVHILPFGYASVVRHRYLLPTFLPGIYFGG